MSPDATEAIHLLRQWNWPELADGLQKALTPDTVPVRKDDLKYVMGRMSLAFPEDVEVFGRFNASLSAAKGQQ